jgi:hypothetical protein
VFGSAGKRNREIGLTIERFTKASSRNSGVVKTLVRLKDLRRMTIHMPRFIGRMTDVEGRTVKGIRSNSIPGQTDGRARLNHYKSRSWEEFECKRARGRGSVSGQSISQASFDKSGPGDVELVEILRFAPAVKQEIVRLRKIVDGATSPP